MSEKVEILCIRCPKGCMLTVTVRGDEILVEGNDCPVGEKYGIEEIKNPKRIVTSTVRILNAKYPRLPVRTAEPVPQEKIKDVIDALKEVVVEAPVKMGQVILKNVGNTGVDVIAERDMERV
ncbi:molybdopterin oxidoreductase [Thermococci archaeon]|nr:MAG: molybdopterin oxidoreductase [Thermococci archaeon]